MFKYKSKLDKAKEQIKEEDICPIVNKLRLQEINILIEAVEDFTMTYNELKNLKGTEIELKQAYPKKLLNRVANNELCLRNRRKELTQN